jgi:hypothetical protein
MTTSNFDTYIDWITVEIGHKNLANHGIEDVLFFASVFDLASKWSNHAIG